jgi:hypothetical protein
MFLGDGTVFRAGRLPAPVGVIAYSTEGRFVLGVSMGKRFIDTAIWDKEWFQNLDPPEKCAWYYLLSRCDAVGVWDVNLPAAEFFVHSKIDWKALMTKSNGNIEKISDKKWWLVDFCAFQYGELRKECKPHVSYIGMLRKHGLFERVCKGYRKSIGTLQEKEKEKELEKEEQRVTEKQALRAAEKLKRRMRQ